MVGAVPLDIGCEKAILSDLYEKARIDKLGSISAVNAGPSASYLLASRSPAGV